MVTSHQVTLSGLAAGTIYNYQVKSTDSKGNHGHGGTTFKNSWLQPFPARLVLRRAEAGDVGTERGGEHHDDGRQLGNYTFAGLANGRTRLLRVTAGFTFTPAARA